jgi:putative oxidoreductase
MTSTASLSRLLFRLRSLAIALQPLAALLTRIVIGWAFFLTGRGKLQNFDNTVKFFTEIGIPMPTANAAFIGSLEMVGGICLILGLGTRVFSSLLACTMVVALMTADRADLMTALGMGEPNPKIDGLLDVTPVPFLLFLLWLIAFGAGKISADRFIFRKLDQVAPA